MKAETLLSILDALPHGAIATIKSMTGKSKTTIYNVLKYHIHRNDEIVKAAIKIIEEKALKDIQLTTKAQKEITEKQQRLKLK